MENQLDFARKVIESKSGPLTATQDQILINLLKENYFLNCIVEIDKNQKLMLDIFVRKNKIEAFKNADLKIPNGTEGKEYECFLDRSFPILDNIDILNVNIPATLGISYFPEERKLYGIPIESGDCKIDIEFKLLGSPEDEPVQIKTIPFLVNADPKTLWKNLPSDKEDPYWKEDSMSAFCPFGSKKLLIGSKRGRSHAHSGGFRDDDFSYFFNPETNWGLIAVADGAGSAEYSRRGSQIACQTVKKYFQELDPSEFTSFDELIEKWIDASSDASKDELNKAISALCVEHIGKAAFDAYKNIKEEAVQKGTEIKKYHTTLIFALVREIKNHWFFTSFWIGDGGIGVFNESWSKVEIFGKPDGGEYAGQTRFLTMSDTFENSAYVSRVRFKIIDSFTTFILMTDGITDPKFQTDANFEKVDYWRSLWADLNGQNEDKISIKLEEENLENAEANILNWIDFWSVGNHDDRTIAILY